jgi:hypothetical protein
LRRLGDRNRGTYGFPMRQPIWGSSPHPRPGVAMPRPACGKSPSLSAGRPSAQLHQHSSRGDMNSAYISAFAARGSARSLHSQQSGRRAAGRRRCASGVQRSLSRRLGRLDSGRRGCRRRRKRLCEPLDQATHPFFADPGWLDRQFTAPCGRAPLDPVAGARQQRSASLVSIGSPVLSRPALRKRCHDHDFQESGAVRETIAAEL